MDSRYSYSAVTISKLVLDTFNTKFLALVVNKGDPRSINLRRGETKSVLNFTLRDSESDSINASVWGEKCFIEGLSSEFRLGDVVEIRNAIIQAKRDENSKFNPSVSSPYQLSFSDTRGEIKLRCNLNSKFQHLLQCVPPSYAPCYTISDLIYSADNITGRSISLLAAIQKVDAVTNIFTKDGRHLKKLDIKVFDQSYPSFGVTLWGGELSDFAANILKPKMVVLFCDLRMQFNQHVKFFTASSTSVTTLVINPDFPEALELARYSQAVNIDAIEDGSLDLTKRNYFWGYSYISEAVMVNNLPQLNVAQIGRNLTREIGETEFIVIFNGFLSRFNLDGPLSNVISEQCSECRKYLKRGSKTCANDVCRFSSDESKDTVKMYTMNCSISDHTGTIENCMMKGDVVSHLIGVEAKEFLSLTDTNKTHLKWNYLLERCKMVLSIPRNGGQYRYSRILKCAKANLEDIYGTV